MLYWLYWVFCGARGEGRRVMVVDEPRRPEMTQDANRALEEAIPAIRQRIIESAARWTRYRAGGEITSSDIRRAIKGMNLEDPPVTENASVRCERSPLLMVLG